MSHFLEHMLFLGSDKYPEDEYFSNLIKTTGGNYNAYTSQEETNYFFAVPTSNFIKVIDVWSRFFIDPTLSEKNAAREVNAVTSEWRNGLSRPAKRMYNLLKALAREDHPFHKFSVGNIDTLIKIPENKGLDPYKALRDYYKYYKNNR
jgi:insulysin